MRLAAVALLAVAAAVALVTGLGPGGRAAHARHSRRVSAARRRAEVVRLGESARGRPIDAVHIGSGSRTDLLVVGCVHGNEPAGIAVTRTLRRMLAARPVDAWLIDDLNPDGRAVHSRVDGRGVDLNRNFPWRWRHLFRRGDPQYGGPRALSEPESRAAARLIRRVRPRISIWFHQPLAIVDKSGGSVGVERRFSRLSGLPFRRLTRYPGSAVGWEDHVLPGSTAFVVELPPGRLTPAAAVRLARSVAKLIQPRPAPSRARSAPPAHA
ncbi:MAG: murein peptide amidase [Thermoleophilaceae bacterium]|nr:murein peptide amidase [Thermoleophilaceae bacterium]